MFGHKFVVALLKKGRSLPKQQIRDLATGPKSQIRSKMSAVSSKSALWAESETSEGPKMQKLSTPHPQTKEFAGSEIGEAKWSPGGR